MFKNICFVNYQCPRGKTVNPKLEQGWFGMRATLYKKALNTLTRCSGHLAEREEMRRWERWEFFKGGCPSSVADDFSLNTKTNIPYIFCKKNLRKKKKKWINDEEEEAARAAFISTYIYTYILPVASSAGLDSIRLGFVWLGFKP